MYSATGGKFTYGTRITYSFIPDGTSLGGPTSNLLSTMDARFGSRAAWTAAFAAAAADWQYAAQVNLVQVSDNGAPLGTGSLQQGDPNFGDIRIGGYSQGGGTLAWTFSPPPINGGPLAGDILFNTSQLWQIDHDFDLQSVAIHEFGHSLGLGHSSIQTSDMFPYYQGVRQTLSTDDIGGIQAIWGARTPDWTNSWGGNSTRATAYDTGPNFNSYLNQVMLWELNITNASDNHWYKVTTPANASSTLTATMQAAGRSLLSPRVQIYNAAGVGLAQATAPSSATGANVSASIYNATPNTVYYIRTLAGAGAPTGAGAYALTINMGNMANYPMPLPSTTVANQPDQGGGGSALEDEQGRGKYRGNRTADESEQDHDHGWITIGSLSGYGDSFQAPKSGKSKGIRRVIGFQHPKSVVKAFAVKRRGFAARINLRVQA